MRIHLLRMVCRVGVIAAMVGPAVRSTGQAVTSSPVSRVAVVFSGGHETDPRDRGRPVVLIAGALGVTPEVFREAFSQVRPAQGGTEPQPDQVRENKAALMRALGPHGVTNERLDTVSNYYRYNQRRGEMWPTKVAVAYALVSNGAVTGFVVENGGSGYSSPPTITVPGMSGVRAEVRLSYGSDFAKNGSVSAITLAATKAK